MNTYLMLLRGINVGGKNTIPMRDLAACLEELGFKNVRTFIASGNVFLESDETADRIKIMVENSLRENFKLDSEHIKVLVLNSGQLLSVIENKPKGFGEQPDKYHSDVIFLIDIDVDQATSIFNPREGVDEIWPGNGVVYSQRLSALRTKSRLNKIMESPLYKSMTVRSWNTTYKLSNIMKEIDFEK